MKNLKSRLTALALVSVLGLAGCSAQDGTTKPDSSSSASAEAGAEDPTGFVTILKENNIKTEPVNPAKGTKLELPEVEGWTTSTDSPPPGTLAIITGPRGESGFIPNLVVSALKISGDAKAEEIAQALATGHPGTDVQIDAPAEPGDTFTVTGGQVAGDTPMTLNQYGRIVTEGKTKYLLLSQLSATTADADAQGEAIQASLPTGITLK
ncbi:LpqN/LpqT family lipoprotein [Mycetocola saprophilus]|uniref:LpqN/LpqT family lipoprotein n=1 Tax=Mycetocola saprophilus TaxID=76636 RepID=UPI0004C13211|nr:LpqN/LpqT family lipoprotein [Mycetocola saprophilus]